MSKGCKCLLRICSAHSCTLLDTYSSMKASDPRAAPRWHFPEVMILMSVSVNACSALERYSSLTIKYVLAAFG